MIDYDYTPEVLLHSKEMDESTRQDYVNKVYRYLMNLKRGSRIPINNVAKSDTRDLFIEVIKMYILETGGQLVEFDGDYSIICKIR